MEHFLFSLGHFTLNVFETAGRFVSFLLKVIKSSVRPPFYPKLILKQFFRVGFYSLPVVGLTALFAGMVLALQTYSGFSRFSAEGAVSMVVVISMVREMGPVFAGLMVAGRVGAAMAAELGTMRVSEQIDALKTLAVRPFHYLVAPRVIATVLMLPLLTMVADIIGVFGGFLISVEQLGFNPAIYLQKTFQYLETIDVVSGLVKATVFGFFIAGLGCYHGYYSKGGAEGVGKATTLAVVSGSVVVLLMNYFLTELFFGA
ncbi:MAG: ABC transporter permease [Alphaproteobacteria bacterium]|nr:ABC transporter permease [Alphaproteobacteria bacterium]MBN2780113.1 ABC transporter permease [Alphaproteobacteria bacterium]